MSKANFPHLGRSGSEQRDEKRESGLSRGNLPFEKWSDSVMRQDAGGAERGEDTEHHVAQPGANARQSRNALSELESRLARLSGENRGADMEKALSGLDQHLADIARRLNEDVARRREATAESFRGAFAPGGLESAPGSRVDDLQRSIDRVTRSLDSFRESAAERGDQQLVTMRQIENIRREIRDMTQALGELAPRASVLAIETAINDLGQRIESQRERGVRDETLAPAETIISELRPVIEDLDPTPIVRNLRADVETIGIRLEKLQTGNAANASAVRDLARDTHDIKEQLTALMARPLPLEKIEARIIDVTQRVDALTRLSDASGADLGEVVKTIRSIVSAETAKGFESFNSRLDRLAQKLDAVVEQSAAARFDELGERIDELGETLAQRIDRGAANMAPLEALIASLAKKIDSALDGGGHASAFEEIGRRFDLLESRVTESAPTESLARIEAMIAEPNRERQFADLAQRIDQLRQAIAERTETGAGAGDVERFAAVEDLVRGLDRKVDAALASDARNLDLQAVERQLAQLSFKIDRFDDPFFAPRMGGQNAALDEIAERLDRMQTAFAQRIEDGARAEKRESELAVLVESLAERMSRSAGPAVGAEALKSLETQIGALAQRLERIDATNGAFSGFESKINDLLARLEDARSATTEAAEAAVRRAATEILREAASVQAGGAGAALQRELSDIRKAQDASGQRMNETLSAVHQMLERVVSRLGAFEDEPSDMRGVAPKAAPRPAEGIGGDAGGQDLAAVDPLEFLLPVDAGVADRRAPFLAPPGRESDRSGRRASVQSEFIAAARRAAQQPAAEADARPAEAARPAGTAQDREQARGGTVVTLGSAIQDRKRPLLLGLGAVMLLIAAYQIARMGGQGGLPLAPSLNQQEAKAPAKAIRPTPPPEMALASKNAPPAVMAGRSAGPEPVPGLGPVDTASSASTAPTVAAQRNIDPTPTGSIEAPSPSSGDALAAIKRLAQEGQPAAQYELGARLAEGRGAPRDAKAAAHWFEKAAEGGLAPAQYRLGSMYEKGVGVDLDYSRARLWYERAAEAGNARAMHNYAVLLAEGGDGKPDYAASAEWFRRAAEYGVRDSQFNLAILYARGLGVSRNLQQSYAWFCAAADQGDDDAAKKRDEIGARLDSKELAAAKALAAAFRAKAPVPEANDAPALRPGGGEGAREQAPVKPATKPPSGKPRVS
ncbi:MAG: SEL1-like repeat protein [Methylocystis sp.]|nr:SEL1-like repeat protein [Methylocystis sp.]